MIPPTDSNSIDGAVSFHPGHPSMAPKAAELIYQSSHELLDFMFTNQAVAKRALSRLFKKNSGHFSHQFLTAARIDGKVVGIELGYSQEQLKRQELIGSIFLLSATPVSLWWRLATKVGSVVDSYVPKPSDDTYYINNIAVDPNCRGQGIGKRMLMDTIERSREAGYSAVELDVTVINEDAIRFYERHGFTKQSESGNQDLMDAYGLPPLARMLRIL